MRWCHFRGHNVESQAFSLLLGCGHPQLRDDLVYLLMQPVQFTLASAVFAVVCGKLPDLLIIIREDATGFHLALFAPCKTRMRMPL